MVKDSEPVDLEQHFLLSRLQNLLLQARKMKNSLSSIDTLTLLDDAIHLQEMVVKVPVRKINNIAKHLKGITVPTLSSPKKKS